MGPTDFDELNLANETVVCASNCLCDWDGTSSCDEATGVCNCRFPFSGEDCSKCQKGHTKNPVTGKCQKGNLCADHGGDVDCSGHGECEQHGEHAICTCEPGFVNDGLKQCAKCADPLFTYPDCQLRSWILEEPDVSCKDLDYKMPRNLAKQSSSMKAIQGDDGIINWAQRYKLIDGEHKRT